MEGLIGAMVRTEDGKLGRILSVSRPSGDEEQQALVQMENGRQVFIPADLLSDRQTNGEYRLPMDFSRLEAMEESRDANVLVIPILSEKMSVGKRRYSTGGVRISKKVNTRAETIRDQGFEEEVQVERIPVNKIIDQPLKTHFEGKTMVIPIMEEVLSVQKRLMLKEEVRVTKYRKQLDRPPTVELREEEVIVEKLQPDMDFDRAKQK